MYQSRRKRNYQLPRSGRPRRKEAVHAGVLPQRPAPHHPRKSGLETRPDGEVVDSARSATEYRCFGRLCAESSRAEHYPQQSLSPGWARVSLVERNRRHQSRRSESRPGPSALAPVAQPQETKTIKETQMMYLVFVVAVLTRFLMNSHLPGFSPVFGALLLSGARLRKRDAIWFPVVVLAIGDWLLTTQVFHMEVRWEHALTLVAFAAMAWIGGLRRQGPLPCRFAGCS